MAVPEVERAPSDTVPVATSSEVAVIAPEDTIAPTLLIERTLDRLLPLKLMAVPEVERAPSDTVPVVTSSEVAVMAPEDTIAPTLEIDPTFDKLPKLDMFVPDMLTVPPPEAMVPSVTVPLPTLKDDPVSVPLL
jgi:hypothetical protein